MTRLPRLLAASLLCLAATGQLAQAADYPTRPVKWVVPYPPAGRPTCWRGSSRSG
jgi:tripartite-type tricarboxylate transporter receptor subunit TctC